MEKRTLLKRLLRYLFISPYNWQYTLRLPFYTLFPSKKNHCQLPPVPTQFYLTTQEPLTKFIFAGDLMLLNHDCIPELSSELTHTLARADYFLVNCEAPIVNTPLNADARSLLTFSMPLTYLEKIFEQLPIERQQCILSVANNHSRDVTDSVFIEGLKLLKKNLNVHIVGQYNSAVLPFLRLHSKSGLNFAVSAWTQLMNGERFLEKLHIVNHNSEIESTDWLDLKKNHSIDFLIGMPHWGNEYQHYPSLKTANQATHFINQGFDLLVGSHSHVLQSIALINKKLCCFSLGNFLTPTFHWRTKLISLFEVDVTPSGEIAAYQFHFFIQTTRDKKIYVEPLEKAPLKLKTKMEKLLQLHFQDSTN